MMPKQPLLFEHQMKALDVLELGARSELFVESRFGGTTLSNKPTTGSMKVTSKSVTLIHGEAKIEIRRDDFEKFCRDFVANNQSRKRRFGQAFYDHFGLERLPMSEQLNAIYNSATPKSRRLIAEQFGLPSEHLK